jgi:hypothetical protein
MFPILRRRAAHLALLTLATLTLAIATRADAPPAIPHSKVARAKAGDIRSAWLIGQTDRYKHFVLGDRFEAEGLAIRDGSGKVHVTALPGDAVFEDREARIVDLDRDGRSEIAVVVSRQGVGSLLALYGLRDGALTLIAETPPNGRPNRWLNPSGVGRFTGTDEQQIAIVRRPHLDGTLELWAFDGRGLVRRAEVSGYSTHRNGSRHQRLFATIPRPGGKGDLLALPTLDRSAVAILDFTHDPPEIARHPLGGRADGAFRVEPEAEDGGRVLAIPLEGGRVVRFPIEE